jgi:hypothetical protein
MTEKKKTELTEEEKSEPLHKLLFKDKVETLGNLKVEHHADYVVVNKVGFS